MRHGFLASRLSSCLVIDNPVTLNHRLVKKFEHNERNIDFFRSLNNIRTLIEISIFAVGNIIFAILHLLYYLLVDYGYSPQNIFTYVLVTPIIFFFLFHTWLGVVAYSLEGDKDHKKYPIEIIFLFDRLSPAYKICEGSYNIERFYSIAQNGDDAPDQIRYPFRIRRSLVEASPSEKRHAERALDVLRFLGLIFAGFAIAAVSKLVH